jgi:hypothetical protein
MSSSCYVVNHDLCLDNVSIEFGENLDKKLETVYLYPPVTVAELSKVCTVFARSEAGIVGSSPTQGMDV